MLDDDSNVSISHNFDYTAVLYAEMSSIELYSGSTILFLNNTGGHSGAIYLRKSYIQLYGNVSVTFSGNEGRKDGAISLLEESSMYFSDGKVYGTVPTYVDAMFAQPSIGELQPNEYLQSVRKICSNYHTQ